MSYPCLFISDLETIDSNMYQDLLFMFARGLDGSLELLQCILAHSIASGLLDFKDPDKLAFEHLTFSHKLLLITSTPCNDEKRPKKGQNIIIGSHPIRKALSKA
jgi:hypothetical protein